MVNLLSLGLRVASIHLLAEKNDSRKPLYSVLNCYAIGPGLRAMAKTTVGPPVPTAPVGTGARSARGRSVLRKALAALLFGLVLLGPLAFALGLFEGFEATGPGGDKDQSGAEDEAILVQVPDLYWATTAQADLAAVGLKVGRQDETPSDTLPIGVVSEQDPEEGTEAEEGTPVDMVVSTGPARQAPVNDEKEREAQRQEAEKQREKQQQEAEKRKERGD